MGDEFLDLSRYSTTARDQVAVITFSATVSFECELIVIVGKESSRRPSRLRSNLAGKHPLESTHQHRVVVANPGTIV